MPTECTTQFDYISSLKNDNQVVHSIHGRDYVY